MWPKRFARRRARTAAGSDEEGFPGWICFFCGEPADGEPEILLDCTWYPDGEPRQQWWLAHRTCLLASMADVIKSSGGPLVDD